MNKFKMKVSNIVVEKRWFRSPKIYFLTPYGALEANEMSRSDINADNLEQQGLYRLVKTDNGSWVPMFVKSSLNTNKLKTAPTGSYDLKFVKEFQVENFLASVIL